MEKRLTVALLAILTAVPLSAQTVDEIIAKHIESRGGSKALATVHSARLVGRLLVQGMSLPYTIEWKRPDKVRFAYSTHGSQEVVQAFDGTTGWSLSPRDSEPKELSRDEVTRLAERAADIEGDLVAARANGSRVELVSQEPVDDRDAYKLEIIQRDGTSVYVYLDTTDYTLFRKERKSRINGNVVDVASSIGGYRNVGGVSFAHSIDSVLTSVTGEQLGTQSFSVESITLNPDIPDSRFEMPR